MASSSKPDLTNEEFDANQRLVDVASGNSRLKRGQQVHINKYGNIVTGPDMSDEYKFNDITGKWHSHGGGIMTVRDMPARAAAPSGGGGGRPAPAAPAREWRDEVRPTANQEIMEEAGGVTTEDILGDTYAAMTGYTPVTPGQVVNPLVDANNWVTQVNPGNQRAYNDPGIYVNPQVGMLQDSWSNTSTNPYSLLG